MSIPFLLLIATTVGVFADSAPDTAPLKPTRVIACPLELQEESVPGFGGWLRLRTFTEPQCKVLGFPGYGGKQLLIASAYLSDKAAAISLPSMGTSPAGKPPVGSTPPPRNLKKSAEAALDAGGVAIMDPVSGKCVKVLGPPFPMQVWSRGKPGDQFARMGFGATFDISPSGRYMLFGALFGGKIFLLDCDTGIWSEMTHPHLQAHIKEKADNSHSFNLGTKAYFIDDEFFLLNGGRVEEDDDGAFGEAEFLGQVHDTPHVLSGQPYRAVEDTTGRSNRISNTRGSYYHEFSFRYTPQLCVGLPPAADRYQFASGYGRVTCASNSGMTGSEHTTIVRVFPGPPKEELDRRFSHSWWLDRNNLRAYFSGPHLLCEFRPFEVGRYGYLSEDHAIRSLEMPDPSRDFGWVAGSVLPDTDKSLFALFDVTDQKDPKVVHVPLAFPDGSPLAWRWEKPFPNSVQLPDGMYSNSVHAMDSDFAASVTLDLETGLLYVGLPHGRLAPSAPATPKVPEAESRRKKDPKPSPQPMGRQTVLAPQGEVFVYDLTPYLTKLGCVPRPVTKPQPRASKPFEMRLEDALKITRRLTLSEPNTGSKSQEVEPADVYGVGIEGENLVRWDGLRFRRVPIASFTPKSQALIRSTFPKPLVLKLSP